MARVRITIQLDRATLASVDKDAARLSKRRSEVLRQAIESRYPDRRPVSEAERSAKASRIGRNHEEAADPNPS
jgi:metal-responsive CopG/Arc/MetJ family transcriptional regulator